MTTLFKQDELQEEKFNDKFGDYVCTKVNMVSVAEFIKANFNHIDIDVNDGKVIVKHKVGIICLSAEYGSIYDQTFYIECFLKLKKDLIRKSFCKKTFSENYAASIKSYIKDCLYILDNIDCVETNSTIALTAIKNNPSSSIEFLIFLIKKCVNSYFDFEKNVFVFVFEDKNEIKISKSKIILVEKNSSELIFETIDEYDETCENLLEKLTLHYSKSVCSK